jgi:antitoxin StbD
MKNQRKFTGILKQADNSPVAVLNHNRPEAYLLPASHYERLMAYIEDMEDIALVCERGNGPFVEVDLQ